MDNTITVTTSWTHKLDVEANLNIDAELYHLAVNPTYSETWGQTITNETAILRTAAFTNTTDHLITVFACIPVMEQFTVHKVLGYDANGYYPQSSHATNGRITYRPYLFTETGPVGVQNGIVFVTTPSETVEFEN